MQHIIQVAFFSIFLLILNASGISQARIEIQNNSMRDMTVKVMKTNSSNGDLYKIVHISPYGNQTVYFNETGHYFTKTKASLAGKKPVCRKGESFKVYNGTDGYSILTLTFTVEESAIHLSSGGSSISESEFDQN